MTDTAIDTSDWRQAVFAATHDMKKGTGSLLGSIVRCLIKKEALLGPKFTGNATITENGFVICDFIDRNQVLRRDATVGHVSDLGNNIAGLADHCKLSDVQRHELATALQSWIAHDHRPNREKLLEKLQ